MFFRKLKKNNLEKYLKKERKFLNMIKIERKIREKRSIYNKIGEISS